MSPGGSSVLLLQFRMSVLLLSESHPQAKFRSVSHVSSGESPLVELAQPVLHELSLCAITWTVSSPCPSSCGLSHSEQILQVKTPVQKYCLCCIMLLCLGVKVRGALTCVGNVSVEIPIGFAPSSHELPGTVPDRSGIPL